MKLLVMLRGVAILAAAVFSAVLPFKAAWAAGSSQDNLDISASIAANCTINAGTVEFGAYDPIVANATTDLPGTGTVSVTCTAGATSLTIELGLGLNATGSTRRMLAGAGEYLTYELYQNVGHTTLWGTTTDARSVATGTGSAQPYTVYGLIPQGQNTAVVGSYTDTVVATINF